MVYADPPYTTDQYSRYYHLYETLLLYDYPEAVGVGRYRPDRSVSSFSLASAVAESMERLIRGAAAIESDLVLSYPTHGLLGDSRMWLSEMMKKHYHRVPEIVEVAHQHSTMGASKGDAKNIVTEVVYWGRF